MNYCGNGRDSARAAEQPIWVLTEKHSVKDANLEQVEDGMAWHYKKYQGEQSPSDRIEYSDAELEAKRLKVGLWHDPNPMPPWDYRQAERNRRKSLEPFVGKSTVR